LSKEESLQYHRFVKKAPEYSAKQTYTYYKIDVKPNFEIDFDSLKEVTDENVIKNKFFYLKFKTGEADSLVKYMYGELLLNQKVDYLILIFQILIRQNILKDLMKLKICFMDWIFNKKVK
jgi:hypothetical protein